MKNTVPACRASKSNISFTESVGYSGTLLAAGWVRIDRACRPPSTNSAGKDNTTGKVVHAAKPTVYISEF